MVHDHVLLYPVMLLEDVEHRMGTAHELLGKALGGKYVYTTRPSPSGQLQQWWPLATITFCLTEPHFKI